MTHDYKDVLLKAASKIEEGWTQRTPFRSKDGRILFVKDRDCPAILEIHQELIGTWDDVAYVCAEGGIDWAAHELGVSAEVANQAMYALAKTIDPQLRGDVDEHWLIGETVNMFNDTHDDKNLILETIRKAAQ